MAEATEAPKGRASYAYVVLAYVLPPVKPAEEIVAREDLTLIGVFEAPTHDDAAQMAAEQFPPRVGEQRTFVATLASKWREFDFGTETKIEVTGSPAQTHPTNPAQGPAEQKPAEVEPDPSEYEDPGASAHPPEPQGQPYEDPADPLPGELPPSVQAGQS